MSQFNRNILAGASGAQGYQISRSVRLRSSASAYFSRTPASAGSRTTWTYSTWRKRGQLGNYMWLLSALVSAGATDGIRFQLDNTIDWIYNGGRILATSQLFRDPSAWYHIVFVWDTTQATSSNRVRVYVNGAQVTAFSTATYPAQNSQSAINNAVLHRMGGTADTLNSEMFDGYQTEDVFVDGQALTPSSFGETNPVTGVWQPKKYAGTYGTNGFYLPFKDNTISVLSDTATVTAPFGGTATNARVTDGAYVTSNTSAGYSFTFVQYDFGSAVWLSRFYITNLYFTGGTSTFQVHYGNDPTWNTYTNAGSLSVTGSAQTFSGSIMGSARYVRLIPTAFGTNGQANVDAFVIYQDGLGNDYSGNSNNWLPNNISLTAGATYDSMIDTPTPYADGGNGRGNYAVMNPLVSTASTMSNANLTVTAQAAAQYFSSSTIPFFSTGKWYCEIVCGSVGGPYTPHLFGVGPNVNNRNSSLSIYLNNYGQANNQNTITLPNDSYTNIQTTGLSYTQATGDIIQFAYDADTGKSWIGINNNWVGTSLTAYNGAPSSGANPTNTFTSGTQLWLFTAPYGSGTAASFNFGQRPFAYTPPTGFKALNTQNLPEPTIKKGNQYFDATTYTGNGSSQTITNSGVMQPDWVWFKRRSVSGDSGLYDSVRGGNKSLSSNTTGAEASESFTIGFNSNGVTIPTADSQVNANGTTYVAWQWKANGAGVTNTAGSITSTVSANTTSGFSVVTYTGTGANATVGHGLGVKPAMIIVKRRNSIDQWQVTHQALNMANQALYLSSTIAAFTDGDQWNNTQPTSTVFSLGAASGSNANTGTYVAYLFAEVAGYSKFGSYTGNGSADGPFVYCGFRPAYVMIKRTDSSNDWAIHDRARIGYNVANYHLLANSSSVEFTDIPIDFLSNGFKLRGTSGTENASGGTYIYAAFAEHPFKNALAR